jgi:L-galactose dehydrogenase
MEYRTLGKTEISVSVIGFGASPLGNEFGSIAATEGERAVHAAIDGGINFFDVSPYYGRTLAEERLGSALDGQRRQVVLATKCGRYGTDSFDFSAARVKSSVEESLRRLRTDYLDVLTAHDIEFGDREQIVHETIPAMRGLQKQGKVRCLGISGLPLKMLADVGQRTEIDVVLSYCHYNLLVRDLDQWLTPTAKAHQIGMINAAPLHMRILTTAGAPAWHPAP